jgi:hypothetical protein
MVDDEGVVGYGRRLAATELREVGRAGRLWSSDSGRAYGQSVRSPRLLLAVLVVAACVGCGESGDDVAADTTATSTSTAATTTLPEETTTTASATTAATAATSAATTTTAATTSTSGGPYVIEDPEFYPLDPLPGSDGAGGSGCAPGAGALPDGVWFGYVLARTPAEIEFDLACFYFGEIAYTEGAADGEEVNNDYYVRNANPTPRTIPVAPSVGVWEIDAGSVGYLNVPFSDWPLDPSAYIACPSDWCGVWLFVNGGSVTEILEQYVP